MKFLLLFFCLLEFTILIKRGSSTISSSSPFEIFSLKEGNSGCLPAELIANAHERHLKTGTTIVGVCCPDGVVLGADTRSTGGPLIVDKNKLKIRQIASQIFCCAAGTSADCDKITLKAAHYLALLRIEKELAGDYKPFDDLVSAALISIQNSIRNPDNKNRKPQSVFILGGVDSSGPSLFQIDMEGSSNRVGYASLGSGSMDALAVLDNARYHWEQREKSSQANNSTVNDSTNNNNTTPKDVFQYHNNHTVFSCCISVSDAVSIVRNAVQAGILNDLGSGSHVDLCVITSGQVKQWRESLVSSWETDRLIRNGFKSVRNEEEVQQVDVGVSLDGLSTVSSTNDVHFDHSNGTSSDNNDNSGSSSVGVSNDVLGKRIFSRKRLVKRLHDGVIKEDWQDTSIEVDLSMEVEVI